MRLSWFASCLLIAASLGGTAAQAAGLLPQDSAARIGLKRGWFAQVASARSTGPITHVVHSQGSILVQTSQGILTVLDADTGRLRWSAQIGTRRRVNTAAAMNDQYAAVVNGSMLYVLDRETGNVLWQRQVIGVPGAGPALSKTHVFVPMLDGLIEAFDLEKGSKQTPWKYKSAGRVLGVPMITPQTVSWTTEKGHLYVCDPTAESIRFRLETRDAIQARPAYWTPNLYACSTDGFVYAINEQSGKIHWKFPLGDAVYEQPVAIEGNVFVVSQLGSMVCLDAKTSDALWHTSGIAQFLAASASHVYVADRQGRMVVLDMQSGARRGSMAMDEIKHRVTNEQSDRIYLANSSGVLQCFHEIELQKPLLHTPPAPPKPATPAKPGRSEAPAERSTDTISPDEPSDPAMDENMPADDNADNPFNEAPAEAPPAEEPPSEP